MAIGTATALIGSAVLGAGASAYSSSKASKAAGKAADQNAQLQREQYQQTRTDLSPWRDTGNVAQGALMERLGLSRGAPAPSGSPAPAAGGLPYNNFTSPPAPTGSAPSAQPYTPATPTYGGGNSPISQAISQGGGMTGGWSAADLANIRKDWPGIEQEFQRLQTMDKNSPAYSSKGGDSLDGFTQWWYDNNRNPADYTYTPQTTQQQPATNALGPADPNQGTFGIDDNGGLGPRENWTRQAYGEAQPDSDAYFSNFEASPGYQFRVNENIRNLNAKYGGRGLLKSGAAMQGISDYIQGAASQEYGNWWGRQAQRLGMDLAQWNQDRNVFDTNQNMDLARRDNIFESDRSYNTGRWDQGTANLFQLSGMGQNAAAGTAAAGQNYANAMTANNNARASVQGNAAIAMGNGINSAINGAATAYGMYSNPFTSRSI
jgi:hypothetical protein